MSKEQSMVMEVLKRDWRNGSIKEFVARMILLVPVLAGGVYFQSTFENSNASIAPESQSCPLTVDQQESFRDLGETVENALRGIQGNF